MVVDILKRILGRTGVTQSHAAEFAAVWGGPSEVGIGDEDPRQAHIKEAIFRLKAVSSGLASIKNELMMELSNLRDKIISYYRSGDIETAEILAAEYDVKRKVLKGIAGVQKLLDVVIGKLSGVDQMQRASAWMNELTAVIDVLTTQVTELSPELGTNMVAVKDALHALASAVGSMSNMVAGTASAPDPVLAESREVLRQVLKEANEEVEQLAPQAPALIDYEELEEKLLDYIRRSGGVIRVRQAAKELGVPPKVVKEALYRLAARGVIVLSKEGGGQASPA